MSWKIEERKRVAGRCNPQHCVGQLAAWEVILHGVLHVFEGIITTNPATAGTTKKRAVQSACVMRHAQVFFEGSFNPKIAFGFPFLSGTYRILRVIELFTDAAKPFGRISMRHQYSDTYIINMHLLT